MIRKFLQIVLITLSTINVSMAIGDPWKIISDAHQAAKNLNYQGIYHFTHNKQTQSIEVTHVFHESDEYTRMILMDGAPGEMLSHGKNTTIYHSNEKNVHIKKRHSHNLFPAVIPDNIDNLKNVYTLHFGKIDRVADRLAQVIVLTPKDQYRFFYHFWVDKKTSLPLKMIVRDKDNDLIEQAAFTKLNVVNTHGDLSWFSPKIDLTKDYQMDETINDLPVQKFWQFSTIPEGFKEVSAKSTRNKGITMLSHQLVFSDGLSYLSVFIQPVQKGHKPRVGNVTMGRTQVCARYYNGFQIMTVGAVPKKTCEIFTKSISF